VDDLGHVSNAFYMTVVLGLSAQTAQGSDEVFGGVLRAAGASITEVERPNRRARGHGKSDARDTLLAARAALAPISSTIPVWTEPAKRHGCCWSNETEPCDTAPP